MISLRKLFWVLMLPVPYLLFFPLLFWVSLVMPFTNTIPVYRRFHQYFGLWRHGLLWWMWHDAQTRRLSLVHELLGWPRQWARKLGAL